MTMNERITTVLIWNGRVLMVGGVVMWLGFGVACATEFPEVLVHWQFWALSTLPLMMAIPGFLMQKIGLQLKAPASSVSLRATRS